MALSGRRVLTAVIIAVDPDPNQNQYVTLSPPCTLKDANTPYRDDDDVIG